MNLVKKYGDTDTVKEGSIFIEQTDPDTFVFVQIQPDESIAIWYVTEGGFSIGDLKEQCLESVYSFMGWTKNDLLTPMDVACGIIEYYGNHYGETSDYDATEPSDVRAFKKLIKLWENKVTKSDKHIAKPRRA